MISWLFRQIKAIWQVDLFRQIKRYDLLICSGNLSDIIHWFVQAKKVIWLVEWFVQVRCTWRLARPRRLSAGTRKPWRPRLTTSQPTWPWPNSFIKRWAISVSHLTKRARCSPPSPPDHGQAIQPTWFSLCKLLL